METTRKLMKRKARPEPLTPDYRRNKGKIRKTFQTLSTTIFRSLSSIVNLAPLISHTGVDSIEFGND